MSDLIGPVTTTVPSPPTSTDAGLSTGPAAGSLTRTTLKINIRSVEGANLRLTSSLRFRLVAAFALTAVLMGGLTLVALKAEVRSQSDRSAHSEIAATRAAFVALMETRFSHLESAGHLVADAPRLKAAMATGDAATVAEEADGFRKAGQADLFAVVSSRRDVLVLIEEGQIVPAKAGCAQLPGIEEALGGLTSRGVLRRDGTPAPGATPCSAVPFLCATVAVPVRSEDEILGVLLLGLKLDDDLAVRMQKVAQVDVGFLSSCTVLGSSWPLDRRGPMSTLAGQRSPTVVDTRLEDRHLMALWGTVPTGPKAPPIEYILVRDQGPRDAQLARFEALLVGGAGLVVLLGVLLANVLAGRIVQGIGVLVEAANQMAKGNFNPALDVNSGDEVGYLAHVFSQLASSVESQLAKLRRINENLRGKIEDILFNETLGDHYTDVDILGRGGMGIVYRAYDTLHRRTVAIKILSPHLAERAETVSRFLREAQILKRLDHPGVIRVFDAGQTKLPFFEMEFFAGRSIQETVETRGPLPLDRALRVGRRALEALVYIHDNGILHRDVKPANIMMDDADGVRLVDFGIARDDGLTEMTRTGQGLGSPAWAAPEVFARGQIDARSDLYGWALTTFYMFTGKNANSMPPEERSLASHWPSVPGAGSSPPPPGLDALLRRALAGDPADRHRSAAEALDAFPPEPPGATTVC